jgi:hypothetical protein
MTDIEKLKKIKNNIELFNKQQQIDILKLFIKNNVNISENLNGSFINLTEVDYKTIIELEKYIEFIDTQNNNLNNLEDKKKNLEIEFFDKTNIN